MSDDKIPESIVIKLFDQVKESSKQNAEQIKDLTRAVSELTRFLEKQPDQKEMKDDFDIHNVETSESLKEIEAHTKNIDGLMVKLSGRVGIMIVAVLVSFAIITSGLIFVR